MSKGDKTVLTPAQAAILADLPEWMFDNIARQCAQEAMIESLLLIMLGGVEKTARSDFTNELFALANAAPAAGAGSFAADLTVARTMHLDRIIRQAVARLAESSVGVPKN